jgi:hypothetical protein
LSTASETTQLNFGKFSPGPEGGKIILTPESTVSVLGSDVSHGWLDGEFLPGAEPRDTADLPGWRGREEGTMLKNTSA